MARIRSIKPEFWGDYKTAINLTRDARLLYISLWNFCDEWARMPGDPRFVKGHCFPYDDDLTDDAITSLLDELDEVGNVVRYTVKNAPYLWLPHLSKHQRLEPHKVPSRHPEPPNHDPSGPRADESARDADESETISALHAAGSREHVAGSRGTRADASPPPPVDNLPGEVAILRSKLEARKLTVRWDKLTTEQLDEIIALVNLHGDGPLVKAAQNAYQPNDPIVFAQGWLKHWRALTAPGKLRAVDDQTCPQRGHTGTVRFCMNCIADSKAVDK